MLSFDDTGDGEPLVLIHGLAASRAIWRHVVPSLPGRRIAVDVPGFGRSPAVGPGFELDRVAQAIWDGLPVEGRVSLVGHSMGGALAITAAALAPERVARLVLCAPAGLRPVPARASVPLGAAGALTFALRRRSVSLASTPLGRRMLLGASTAAGDAVGEADVRGMVLASDGATRVGAALQAVTAADLRGTLAELPVPVGFLWGAHDRVISSSVVVAAARAARPDAPLEFVPRAGHVPMMERPAAFSAMLRQLLAKLG